MRLAVKACKGNNAASVNIIVSGAESDLRCCSMSIQRIWLILDAIYRYKYC